MTHADPTALGPLPKAPTGILGFDEITYGGLPKGRPTLICGTAGSGKTLFAATFLVNGATQFDQPGVFMSFEERAEDLTANVASLGYDLDHLIAERKLLIDFVRVDQNEITEAGDYDLEGLFIRLACAVEAIGAKRIVLDTIEVLFAGLSNMGIVRSEIRRLFAWIKERGLTAVITGERGEGEFTRHGLEEYVSDCVLLVDNRVEDQISTRRLRVVKYRGSAHGTNEYPFLIDEKGISVLPITAAGLEQPVSDDIVSTGVPGLNAMLGRNGFYRGSSVLLSGVAGAGKTVLSSTFADAACRRGERCLFSTFEESPAQICRNARSIGLNLQQHIDSGLLLFDAARPSLFGMEMHLARMYRDLNQFKPDIVIVDPVSAFRGPRVEVQGTLLRIVHMIKNRGITAIFTSMQDEGSEWTSVNQELASLMDTWIKLTGVEANRERKHLLYVIKARGMGHSNQMREYRITVDGIVLMEPSMGPDGVPADTTRATDASWDHATLPLQRMDIERRQLDMPRRRELMERDIAHMRASVQMEEDDLNRVVLESERHRATVGEQSSASSHRIVVG